jgi:hypothetical protein
MTEQQMNIKGLEIKPGERLILPDALSEYKTCPEAMRAAADWQLEQVLIWLDNELLTDEIDVDDVLEDLKKAMRPQQQQENNS